MGEPIKTYYESLLESGDLIEMYPDMTGEWDKDKDFFTTQFNDTVKLLNEEADEGNGEYWDEDWIDD